MTEHADPGGPVIAGGALIGLLRAAGGSTAQRVDRALAVLVEQLGMQVAYVGEFQAGQQVVTHRVFAPGGQVVQVGTTHPAGETLCRLTATGELPTFVGDATADAVLAALGVGAYAGVPLRVGGTIHGALCCSATTRSDTLNHRDEITLRAVAGYLEDLLGTGGQPPADPGLRQLAAAVAAGHDLESLTRPLLELLLDITGLESTFLTLIDPTSGELVVAYARNTGELSIPEGTTSSWQDSLCRRSLEEGRPSVTDVPAVWPDTQVAGELGITSFVSVPVRDAHDELLGTLCGASSISTVLSEHHVTIMTTFGRLLGAQLARENAHRLQTAHTTVLEQRMSALRRTAECDPLTGLANRTGTYRWLHKALEVLTTGDDRLAIAFIDLDRFKTVNDTQGHATGDEILRRLALSLSRTGRPGDLHGRLGGDEFIVAALLPPGSDLEGWQARIRHAAAARFGDVRITGSVGVVTHDRTAAALTVDDLLHHADLAMYEVKHADRAPPPGTGGPEG